MPTHVHLYISLRIFFLLFLLFPFHFLLMTSLSLPSLELWGLLQIQTKKERKRAWHALSCGRSKGTGDPGPSEGPCKALWLNNVRERRADSCFAVHKWNRHCVCVMVSFFGHHFVPRPKQDTRWACLCRFHYRSISALIMFRKHFQCSFTLV